jgi:hypothetical protein
LSGDVQDNKIFGFEIALQLFCSSKQSEIKFNFPVLSKGGFVSRNQQLHARKPGCVFP